MQRARALFGLWVMFFACIHFEVALCISFHYFWLGGCSVDNSGTIVGACGMKKKSVDNTVYRELLSGNGNGVPLFFQAIHTAEVSLQEREEFQEHCGKLQMVSPGVVLPLLGVFPFGDYLLLACERTNLYPLRQRLGEPLPMLTALAVAEQVVQALDAVHAQSLAYKTLTPDTLYVAPDYTQVRLGVPHFPLNIGKHKGKGAEQWAYIAPEQIMYIAEGEPYIADFYSLGIILYEMLLGNAPLPEGEQVDVFQAHLEGVPLLRTQQQEHIPMCVRQVLDGLLAPLPGNRYQSALGILYDIQWCKRIVLGQGDGEEFVTRSRDISARYYYSEKLCCDGESTEVLLEALKRVADTTEAEVLLLTGDEGVGKTTVVRRALAQYSGEVRIAYFPLGLGTDVDVPSMLRRLLACISRSAAMPAMPPRRQATGGIVGRENTSLTGAPLEKEEDAVPHPIGKRGTGQSFLSMVQEATDNSDATEADIEFLLCQALAVLAGGERLASLVIDDIHNAPPAFMKVLVSCIGRSHRLPLLFVGIADNKFAVSSLPDHLRTLAYQDIPVGTTALFPLDIPHICQLIIDTFGGSIDGVELLAELTHRKTSGNPQAIQSFWDSLVAMQVLYFSFGRWNCDIMRLRNMQVAGSLHKVLAKVSEHIPYRMLGELLTALAVEDMAHRTVVQELQKEVEHHKRQVQHSDMYNTSMQAIAKWVTGASSDVLILFDVLQRRIVYTNRAISQFLGYRETLKGEEAEQLFHPQDSAVLWAAFQEQCTTGNRKAVRQGVRLRTASDAWQWCTVWGAGVMYTNTPESCFVVGGICTVVATALEDHGET